MDAGSPREGTAQTRRRVRRLNDLCLCLPWFLLLLLTATLGCASARAQGAPTGRFEVGEHAFLLDGRPVQLRGGEIHYARVPPEYWRHRLRALRAMGLNTVCAYLFWNFHESREGSFDWTGARDVAEFCRIAQSEGLWVILRPGPYACAEWDMGGLPWWLLKHPDIVLRSRDPRFLSATGRWFREVGRVLGPLQIDRGGPIILVQVENEYGFYGGDADYMGALRQQLVDAGFRVPFFACNPTHTLRRGARPDLFQVVNFPRDPEGAFRALRAVQPHGPLMAGEFYSGWYDTWGQPHHRGRASGHLDDLDIMLRAGASFSIYMAHGGTSFGLWAGANRPFRPDTTSYDYDAPVSEAGGLTERYHLTRALLLSHLPAGERLPEPPPAPPLRALAPLRPVATAPLASQLAVRHRTDAPPTFEQIDLPQGLALYRTRVPAGPAATLDARAIHDFAWVSLEGKALGVVDRRHPGTRVELPPRSQDATLELLVYAMGRINFGPEIHDRKGIQGPVTLTPSGGGAITLTRWEVAPLRLDVAPRPATWQPVGGAAGGDVSGPRLWRFEFSLETPADTFLDLSTWGKGVVWLNGQALGRFWNVGPTQSLYAPAPWFRKGHNEVVILDLLGPEQPVLSGRTTPILDHLRPTADFNRPKGFGRFVLNSVRGMHEGEFAAGAEPQEVRLEEAVEVRQFGLESLSSHDGGGVASVAELELLDPSGALLPQDRWTIAYVGSEELAEEDGSAANAINGQTADGWSTAFGADAPQHPHRLVIDLGGTARVGGFRYTPRQGGDNEPGRIKAYRVYLGDELATLKAK